MSDDRIARMRALLADLVMHGRAREAALNLRAELPALLDELEAARVLPPSVHFTVVGDTMAAYPPGARIHCEIDGDVSARVRVSNLRGHHIANFTVHSTSPTELWTETRDVSAALYWSWWRTRSPDERAEFER